MEIIMRGARGSIANPAPDTVFYGGNTACVELRTDGGARIFFDAGTGIREAGALLPESGECHIFISHGHADHIFGLWFFMPIHSPKWVTNLYLPARLGNFPEHMYQCGFFPAPFREVKGDIRIKLVSPGDEIAIPSRRGRAITVETKDMNHPGGGLGFRVSADGALFVYSGDHEIDGGPESMKEAAKFLRNADIAVVDATYGWNDYRPGWGHSRWQDWIDAAKDARVRYLVLTHHDPVRPDQELDRLDQTLALIAEEGGVKTYVAREGMRFTPLGPIPFTRHGSDWLLLFLDELSRYRDESAILDRILAKAREITHADAGTIYLREENELVFSYTHNDTLFPVDAAHKHVYANIRIAISETSIAGYVASTGNPLTIDDVRKLPPGAPYSFNDSFDRASDYHTSSMLVIPFFDNKGDVAGVMQVINSIDPHTGRPCPFTMNMAHNVRILAREVGGIIEHSMTERRGIYGILRMAAVHDPSETSAHAERVGAIAAELYHAWAQREGRAVDAIRVEKSRIRLAAMLHDIGKVGISDLILKKPGKLTDEEFRIMRGHTEKGASILAEDSGDIARHAFDIALYHHQKWNGSGYAGSTDEGRLSGEDIPLGARITAIADVFDALVSPRCYKKPWSFDDALKLLKKEAGSHFDPALVDDMLSLKPLLAGIYARFPEAGRDECQSV
ncbi:MAG: HD domain-containing protein [Synergistaceae bacterium]|jgi:HD-GYP domain-containing protein (c-di-GMP phosphodiesterase class II)/phosphoribosyl 1,2-cyclic phosphodiesterase|nr:HD domain-containing protein [Synergistaceae bacterium]